VYRPLRYAVLLLLLLALLAGCLGAGAPVFAAYPAKAEALGKVLNEQAEIVYEEPFADDRTLVLFRTAEHPGLSGTLLERTAFGRWRMTDAVSLNNGLARLGSLTVNRANLGRVEERVGTVTHDKAEAHVVFGEVLDPAITWVELTPYIEGAQPIKATVANGAWLVHLPPDRQNTWFDLKAGNAGGVRFAASLARRTSRSTDSRSSPLAEYGDALAGIRIRYPESIMPLINQDGWLTFPSGNGSVAIRRSPRDGTAGSPQDLMARYLRQAAEAPDERVRIDEQETRRLGGHEAAYVRETAEGSGMKRYTAHYFVLTQDAAYEVTCGTNLVKLPLPWEEMKPVCDRLLETIQLGP
jgi:hypothetical protein